MPLLDKYCILIQNNIFSLGGKIEFEYTFQDGSTFAFEQDLRELIFDDYTQYPTEEELNNKPYAIPYYPSMPNGDQNKLANIVVTLASGKVVSLTL